ncbi:zinc knuckle CX2CX4HX4C containing protein [Tanacetum coccineum]
MDKYYIKDLKKEITFVTRSESSGLYLLDMDFDTSLDLNMLKFTHVSTYERGDALIVCKPHSEPTLLGVLVSSDEAVELNLLSVVNSMTGVMLDVVQARVMHEASMGTLAGNGVTTDIDGMYRVVNVGTTKVIASNRSTSPNSVHNSDPSVYLCPNDTSFGAEFVGPSQETLIVSGQHGLDNIIGSINNQVDSSNPTSPHGICDTANPADLNTSPETIKSLLEKFLADMFDSDKGLQDVLKSGSWMIRNSLIILKKWMMNTSLFKEELTRILVWVKLHDVPVQVFLEDGISLIATQIGKPIMLDSFTSLMCIDS